MKKSNKKGKLSKIFAAALAIGVAASLWSSNNSTVSADTSKFAGTWSGQPNYISLYPVMKGDLLFGYNNGNSYGYFSHVAIARENSYWYDDYWGWDGRVIESTNQGTPSGSNSVYTNHWQDHFKNYDAASLDYLSKSGYYFNVNSIVDKASYYWGPYDWSSSFSDNYNWYCSKLVSRAIYDTNGYHLGFSVWGKFIAPADIWWDNAVIQRSHAQSSAYDGGSRWTASLAKVASDIINDSAKTFSYNGITVHAKNLNAEAKQIIDKRLQAEKDAGKPSTQAEFYLGDAKPGLNQYLAGLLKEGKATKQQIQEKWNLTNDEIKKLN